MDISIKVLTNSGDNPCKCIITDDKPFALIACKKYEILTIYYNEIRTGSWDLISQNKKIPEKFLNEPTRALES